MAKARDLLCCSLNCGALSTRRATGRALFLASNAQRDMDSPKGLFQSARRKNQLLRFFKKIDIGYRNFCSIPAFRSRRQPTCGGAILEGYIHGYGNIGNR